MALMNGLVQLTIKIKSLVYASGYLEIHSRVSNNTCQTLLGKPVDFSLLEEQMMIVTLSCKYQMCRCTAPYGILPGHFL